MHFQIEQKVYGIVFVHKPIHFVAAGQQLTKETFKLLSAYYPERLGTCLLAETPWMFSAVWYVCGC